MSENEKELKIFTDRRTMDIAIDTAKMIINLQLGKNEADEALEEVARVEMEEVKKLKEIADNHNIKLNALLMITGVARAKLLEDGMDDAKKIWESKKNEK